MLSSALPRRGRTSPMPRALHRSSWIPTRHTWRQRPGRSGHSRSPLKSLSHNVRNAGSFLRFVVPGPHVPHHAERWRGGDGDDGDATAADDLGDPGRLVAHRGACPAARRGAAFARPTLDSPAPHSGRRALRAADRLPVEGGASHVRVGIDGPSPFPAMGRVRRLGSDVAAAAPVL
jgi:hypothetical protein